MVPPPDLSPENLNQLNKKSRNPKINGMKPSRLEASQTLQSDPQLLKDGDQQLFFNKSLDEKNFQTILQCSNCSNPIVGELTGNEDDIDINFQNDNGWFQPSIQKCSAQGTTIPLAFEFT